MAFAMLSYADAEGQHEVLLDRDSTSIGRLPGQDVVLRDQCVSRQHATILLDNDCYSIVDRNSSHGTFLNGVRIDRAPLKPGDILQLGSLGGTAVPLSIFRTCGGFGRCDRANTAL
jgi:sigma-B regulation protein RsbU (phosphoserine phosphatase)